MSHIDHAIVRKDGKGYDLYFQLDKNMRPTTELLRRMFTYVSYKKHGGMIVYHVNGRKQIGGVVYFTDGLSDTSMYIVAHINPSSNAYDNIVRKRESILKSNSLGENAIPLHMTLFDIHLNNDMIKGDIQQIIPYFMDPIYTFLESSAFKHSAHTPEKSTYRILGKLPTNKYVAMLFNFDKPNMGDMYSNFKDNILDICCTEIFPDTCSIDNSELVDSQYPDEQFKVVRSVDDTELIAIADYYMEGLLPHISMMPLKDAKSEDLAILTHKLDVQYSVVKLVPLVDITHVEISVVNKRANINLHYVHNLASDSGMYIQPEENQTFLDVGLIHSV